MINRDRVKKALTDVIEKIKEEQMKPTVDMVVKGLLTQGYKEIGGSDVFRILTNPNDRQVIKVFYNDYDDPTEIYIRESISSEETSKRK